MAAAVASRQIALFVAFASALHIAETFLPSPLPGVRLGLANILTLVALVHLGVRPALFIASLRVLTSSLVLGTLLTPGFMIGFSAAVASSVVMALAYYACGQGERPAFSLVGISLLGALTHNAAQLGVVYTLFIPHAGILWLIPWLGLSAVITGWITGLVGIQVSRRLDTVEQSGKVSATAPPLSFPMKPAATAESTRMVLVRLTGFGVLVCLTLLVQSLAWQAGLSLLVIVALAVSRVPVRLVLRKLKKMSLFLAMAFVLPAAFHTTPAGGETWLNLHFSAASLAIGGQWLLRIVILLSAATWLTQTTSAAGLARGLQIVFAPLQKLGARTDQWGEILAWSVQWTPMVLERLKKNFQAARAGNRNPGESRWAGLSRVFTESYISVLGNEHPLE